MKTIIIREIENNAAVAQRDKKIEMLIVNNGAFDDDEGLNQVQDNDGIVNDANAKNQPVVNV